MTDSALTAPVPVPDPESTGYWEALGQGRLALGRCADCGLWMQPPLERCRRCGGPTAFAEVSGEGTIFSFIVVRRQMVPGHAPPYVVALVELEEQPGLRLSGIVEVEPTDVSIGARVRFVVPVVGSSGFVGPRFEPVAATALPLEGVHVTYVLLRRPDGSPTGYPMTAVFGEGAVEFTTYRKSAKASYLLRDNRVCCLVPDPAKPGGAVAMWGRAEPADVPTFTDRSERGSSPIEIPASVRESVRDRLATNKRMVFRVRVDRVRVLEPLESGIDEV